MSAPRPIRANAPRTLDRILSSRLIAALTSPRHVDDYLALVDPLWSVTECRARIVAIHRETPDMITVELAPNDRFQAFQAGEWATLTAVVDGRRVSRCFSFSSAPSSGRVTMTVRVRKDGALTRWLSEDAKPGDIVLLGEPQGEFVLPESLPERILLVSGGSGITPCLSILREVAGRSLKIPVTLLHFARHYEDVPALAELRRVSERSPNVKVVVALTRGEANTGDLEGHVSEAMLAKVAPDAAHGHVYVCGPDALVHAVSGSFANLAQDGRLHVERFSPPSKRVSTEDDGAPRRLAFKKSGVIASGDGKRSLLVQAESAGLSPKHGCRMGICQSCRCTKTSGTVRDDITGELLDDAITDIRLCVTTPVTDITLDL